MTPIPFLLTQTFAEVIFQGDDRDTQIVLSFSKTIRDLRLQIGDLDTDFPGFESLQDFSVDPDIVDGDLNFADGVITSSSNNSAGELFWNELNSNSLTFSYTR